MATKIRLAPMPELRPSVMSKANLADELQEQARRFSEREAAYRMAGWTTVASHYARAAFEARSLADKLAEILKAERAAAVPFGQIERD